MAMHELTLNEIDNVAGGFWGGIGTAIDWGNRANSIVQFSNWGYSYLDSTFNQGGSPYGTDALGNVW